MNTFTEIKIELSVVINLENIFWSKFIYFCVTVILYLLPNI